MSHYWIYCPKCRWERKVETPNCGGRCTCGSRLRWLRLELHEHTYLDRVKEVGVADFVKEIKPVLLNMSGYWG